jgi:hypothetical protein
MNEYEAKLERRRDRLEARADRLRREGEARIKSGSDRLGAYLRRQGGAGKDRRGTMTKTQARALLRKACEEAGSLRAWAREHQLSAAFVSDVLLGRRNVGPAICAALGLTRIVTTKIAFKKEEG